MYTSFLSASLLLRHGTIDVRRDICFRDVFRKITDRLEIIICSQYDETIIDIENLS